MELYFVAKKENICEPLEVMDVVNRRWETRQRRKKTVQNKQ